jgi:hypothetical protein
MASIQKGQLTNQKLKKNGIQPKPRFKRYQTENQIESNQKKPTVERNQHRLLIDIRLGINDHSLKPKSNGIKLTLKNGERYQIKNRKRITSNRNQALKGIKPKQMI